MRAALTALACVAALLGFAPSAHAQDQRPCVSKREYWGLHGGDFAIAKPPAHGLTRAYVERRWDVTGVGRQDLALTDKRRIGYDYPVCGYSFSHAQVWAVYDRGTGFMTADLRWIEPGAPHRPNV